MKMILVLMFCLTGCAGKYVVEESACDAVMNRDAQSVCGRDHVRKNCQPYNASGGKIVNTCEKL